LEEATEAVAGSFGALPLRSTVDPMADRRAFVPGATPQRLEVRYQGKGTIGSVALAWPLPDVVGQEDDCRLRLLAEVLDDRIRVRLRQEMGKTYSPVVGLMAERALAPAMLYLRCRIETAPRQVGVVAEAAKQVVAALVAGGFSDEELERARLPLIRAAEENAVSNKWWLATLSDAQTKPQFVEGQADQKRILQAVTRAELESLARLLFAPDRLCELRVMPE
jgi:zinc protease